MKNIYILALLLLVGVSLKSQINLNTQHLGTQTYDIAAPEYVKMLPGFQYKPYNTNHFRAYIDPNSLLVIPIEYIEKPIDPEHRDIITDYKVGSTPGYASVSLSGGATYNIPIFAPPGTAGMQPSVSLAYSSQQGNGNAGYGWNITGMSYITRVGHTIYHDEAVKGVDFNNDRFSLDGQRLLKVEGVYGDDGTVYYTEVFNGNKIISHGTTGAGPEWFEVIGKDGSIVEYGKVENARLTSQRPDNTTITWCINKITDPNGNYMLFLYNKKPLEINLKEIRYTGNESTDPEIDPYNSIKFYYGERTDISSAYIAGSRVEQTQLLDHISILAENTIVKTYKLNYYYNLYSKLNEVEEYGKDGSRFNSIVFGYEDDTIQHSEKNKRFSNLNSNFFADFDGDGVTDIFRFSPTSQYPNMGSWSVYPDMDKANSTRILDYGRTGDSVTGITLGDYNGDGYSDAQLYEYDYHYDANNNRIYSYQLRGLYSNGTDLIKNIIDLGSTNYKNQVLSGDFDGDNKDEILLLQQTSMQTLRARIYKIINSDLNLTNPTFTKSIIFDRLLLTPLESIDSTNFQILDIDGDGIDEFLIQEQSTQPIDKERLVVYKFLLNPTNNYNILYTEEVRPPYYKEKIFTGDFNGDGNSDMLYSINHRWYTGISNGQSFITNVIPMNVINVNPNDTLVQMTVQDFNQDGKTDIAYSIFNPISYNLDIHILTSNGLSFTDFNYGTQLIDTLTIKALGNKFKFRPQNTYPVDFNGDGNGDYVFEAQYSYNQTQFYDQLYISRTNPGFNPLTVKKTCNGLNLLSSFEYKPLTNVSIYTKSTSAVPNCMNIQPPQFVVSSFNTQNGIGGINSKHYKYSGAIINLTGKGYLGFRGITVIDSLQKIINNSTFTPDPNYFILNPVLAITKTLSDTILNKSIITNSYKAIFNAPDKVIFPYFSKTYSLDYFTNTKKATTNTYDVYANLTSKIDTIYPSFDASAQAEFVGSISYSGFVNCKGWCPAKPSDIIQTMERDEEVVITTKKHITYWPLGNIKTVTDFYEQDSAVETTYSGYIAGLAISSSIHVVNRGNTDDIVQQVTYDDKYRFPLTTIDALGFSASATFDAAFGNKLTQTDANELTTTYLYDGFGRPLKITDGAGVWVSMETQWLQNSSMENVLFYTKTTSNNLTPKINYFDKLGRPLYTNNEYNDGSKAIIETKYNEKGLVAKVSEPYFENLTPSQYTITKYDDFNRPEVVTLPTQAKISYTYPTPKLPGRSTSMKNSITGITITKTTNATGLLESSTDPGGTIVYAYYSNGQLKSTTTPDGSITLIEYDRYSRQTLLDDPDAGTTNYKYNALGQLQKQTDARGVMFEILFDKAGRLVKQTGSNASGSVTTLTNTYNPPTAPKGSRGLQAVSQFIDETENTTRYNYSYDVKARLAQMDIACSGRVFTYNYEYTDLGNLKEYTYPSGYTIAFDYMDNKGINKGVLKNVTQKSDSKVIYEPLDYNARGQLLHYKIANGSIFTTLEFDEYGMPTFIKTGQNIAGASEIQKLETNFNIFTGNLAYRKDHNYMMGGNALQEVFTYDDVFKNSLETWQVDLQTQYSMTVEAATGNILTKSDVTSTGNPYLYSKDNAGPHAVTGITAPLQLPADALQQVKYNLFQKVQQVFNNLGYSLSIKYGPNEQRIKSEYYTPNGSSSVLSQTKFFIGGDYEVEVSPNGSERYLHYLPGGGLFVSHLTPGSDSLNFVLTDYQGTWYKVINENGATVEHYSFDPWGGRRNATDWTYHNVPTAFKFSRGYTGHEMLDAFGLINMNGRVYDPIVARFLSPDAYVQNPEFSHSYNRYSYCFNNPLKYTDPSGMQSIYNGVYNPAQPANRGGQNGPQIYIDGIRYDNIFGLSGSLNGGGGGVGSALNIESKRYAGDLSGYGINPMDIALSDGTVYSGVDGFNFRKGLSDGTLEYHNGKFGNWVNAPLEELAYTYISSYPGASNMTAEGSGATIMPIFVPFNATGQETMSLSDALEWVFGAAGSFFDIKGNALHNDLYWKGKTTGKIYTKNPFTKNNVGWKANSFKATGKAFQGAKSFGTKLGIAGLALTGADMIWGDGLTTSNVLDATFGAAGFIPGVGWMISGSYFLVNTGFQLSTGKSIGEYIDE